MNIKTIVVAAFLSTAALAGCSSAAASTGSTSADSVAGLTAVAHKGIADTQAGNLAALNTDFGCGLTAAQVSAQQSFFGLAALLAKDVTVGAVTVTGTRGTVATALSGQTTSTAFTFANGKWAATNASSAC